MFFRILGPLAVTRGDEAIDLGPAKQRAVLAALLCHANAVVPTTHLLDVLWPDRRPESAVKNLQAYVSGLRKLVPAAIGHESPGYRIAVAATELDAAEFAELSRRGGAALRAGDPSTAAELLRAALRLWRGPALAAFDALRDEAGRLAARRLDAYELLIDAHLATGTAGDLLDEIEELCRAHPLRERLRGRQMAALGQAGRGTDALAVFDEIRQGLARELGIAPSPVLARQYEALLAGTRRHPRPMPLCHLPRDVTDFTGRTGEIDRLLSAPPVAVVHGPPGVGKTTLAVHVAHRLRTSYPDGAILVPVRGRPPADVLTELLRRLGADPTATDEDDLAAALHADLAGRRVLLILDDVPDADDVRSLLPGAGGSAAIVTSRRLLAIDSARYVDVPPLPLPDAVELLGRIVAGIASDVAAELAGRARLLPRVIRAVATKLVARGDVRCHPSVVDPCVRPVVAALLADLTPAERAVLATLTELPRPLGADVDDVMELLLRAHAATEDTSGVMPRYRLAKWLRGSDFGRPMGNVARLWRIHTELELGLPSVGSSTIPTFFEEEPCGTSPAMRPS